MPKKKKSKSKVKKKVSRKIKPRVKKRGVKKKVSRKIKPRVKKKVTKKVAPKKQYYAQVASLTKYAPNKKFLKSIKTAGYEYKIVEKNVKGIQVKRVYVGPFNSRGKANLELDNIRAKISTSAYVVKD